LCFGYYYFLYFLFFVGKTPPLYHRPRSLVLHGPLQKNPKEWRRVKEKKEKRGEQGQEEREQREL